MRIVFFGTFDEAAHPRVRVLREGLVAHGHDVITVNEQLEIGTDERLEIARKPWKALLLLRRVVATYLRLAKRARSLERPPDTVIVGYLGVLDVHLARLLFRAPIVLDHMAPVAGTLEDRRLGGWRFRVASAVDRLAERSAQLVLVDTEEHLAFLAPDGPASLVVPVGAPEAWFEAAARVPPRSPGRDLRVVFFGLYTPLQGIETIARAIEDLGGEAIRWTLIGHGQDRSIIDNVVSDRADVQIVDWLDADVLPSVVADHDVCLGIFGQTPKALRVVPNKVYQGAAAGCVVVTSDTPCQRSALGELGRYVPAGDSVALTTALTDIADQLASPSPSAALPTGAAAQFRPREVTELLHQLLSTRGLARRSVFAKLRRLRPLRRG